MAVAAANMEWFPKLFSLVGSVGVGSRANSHGSAETDAAKDNASDAPINALILSAVLSSFYILLGNFRALLTFNGLGEYTFFFLTVMGAIVLRFREPWLERPYKPSLFVPVVFSLVSGFVVLRGAIFAPLQAAILLGLWVLGVVFYLARRRWLAIR